MTTRANVERARDIARRRLRVDDYVTIPQIAELTGLSKHRTSELLEELVARGEAICTQRVPGKGNPRRFERVR